MELIRQEVGIAHSMPCLGSSASMQGRIKKTSEKYKTKAKTNLLKISRATKISKRKFGGCPASAVDTLPACCWAVERAADANRFGEMIHECWLGLLQLQHLVKCNAIESNSLKSCAETKTWRLSGKLENC